RKSSTSYRAIISPDSVEVLQIRRNCTNTTGDECVGTVTVPTSNRTDIQWIQRDRRIIDGLDHLGIQLVSVNLYQAMLPAISNVTERARYYSFYPWVLHRYAQEGPTVRDKVSWRRWFRALEFSYAVACVAYEQQ